MKDDVAIMTTKKPFYYYLTVILISGIICIFISVLFLRQFIFDEIVSLTIFFFFFIILVYINLGQYLATISLYKNKMEVKYIFPWNKSFVFEFQRLTIIQYEELHFQSFRDRWKVGGNRLVLKNQDGCICHFEYNINDSDDDKMIEILRKISVNN